MLSLEDLPRLLPSASQVMTYAAVLMVFLALVGVGALAAAWSKAGRARIGELDVVSGWGATCILSVLAGAHLGLSLAALAWLVTLVGLAGLLLTWRRGLAFPPSGLWRLLILAIPLFAMTISLVPYQWDEFSHWLHSARYLFEVDAFPAPGLPESKASFPAYPYALPLVGQMASTLAGQYAETALIAFNTLLMVVMAGLLARMALIGLTAADGKPAPITTPVPGWGLCGLALLGATLFCPTFVAKVALTSYAETATAVATMAATVAGWLMLERLIDNDRRAARLLLIQGALSLVVLIWLKQATLALYLVVAGGLALVALRAATGRRLVALGHVAAMAVPGLLLHWAWRTYVARTIPGQEFGLRPFADWNIHLMGDILAQMGHVAAAKGGHFGVMLVVAIFAIRALWRCRSPLDRLALVAGSVMIGYNLFLFFTYVAVFGPNQAVYVVSYWRYNMHVGPIGSAFAFFGLAMLWQMRPRRMGSATLARRLSTGMMVLALIAPVLLAGKLRYDFHAVKTYVREVGQEMNRIVPPEARLIVIDPLDPGLYVLYMDYMLSDGARVVGRVARNEVGRPEYIANMLSRPEVTHLWVHSAHEATETAIGIDLDDEASHLLVRDSDSESGWSVVKSWPYPGYASPLDVRN